MKSSQRVFVNTFAQYVRTTIVMLLSLYIVRVVLASLGQSDYGIYTLVAGCVAMLGFLTNSLVRTTQRFVSFYQGKKDMAIIKLVFNNCLVIHIIIGIFVVLVLEALAPFFFNGFLNIPADRIDAAYIVYHFVVILLLVTILTSPYRALLVSHENIVYISVVDVLDIIFKLLLVVFINHVSIDKLIFYSVIMLLVQILNFLAISTYCYKKYEECVSPQASKLQKNFVKEMGRFAGWQIYGTACNIGRSQGLAIVLNRCYGTIMNAGLGIGTQISGATNTLSSAIVNAMSPLIVKAEGAGERNRTIWLSNVLSKMVFFLMSLIGIPILFELPGILDFWLGSYPESAVFFGRMYVVELLFDSLTIGLTHINNAIGKIGQYIVIMSTPKLLTILFVLLILNFGLPLLYVAIVYVGIEASCALIRIPLINKQAGLNIKNFFTTVIIREIPPVLISILICLLSSYIFEFKFRFIFTFCVSALAYCCSMYFLGFTKREKEIIDKLVKSGQKKFLSFYK